MDVGLLVGVEVPNAEAVDVLPAAFPNRPPPPAVAFANGFADWVVAGDFGCEFCPKPKPAEAFWFPVPKVLVPPKFPPPPPPNKLLPWFAFDVPNAEVEFEGAVLLLPNMFGAEDAGVLLAVPKILLVDGFEVP